MKKFLFETKKTFKVQNFKKIEFINEILNLKKMEVKKKMAMFNKETYCTRWGAKIGHPLEHGQNIRRQANFFAPNHVHFAFNR